MEQAVAVSNEEAVAAFEAKVDDDALSVTVGEMLGVCDKVALCVIEGETLAVAVVVAHIEVEALRSWVADSVTDSDAGGLGV